MRFGHSTFALVVLTSGTFAVGFGELVIAGILPAVASGLHISLSRAGILTTAYALTFAMLSPILAPLFRGALRRRGLILGLALVALGQLGAFVAPTYATVVAARIVAAVGSAIASPLALALIDDVVPTELRGRAQGIVFAGFGAALTLSLPLATLLAGAFGWRAVFALASVIPAIVAVLALQLRIDVSDGRRGQGDYGARWRSALSPAILRLLGVSLFMLVGQYTVMTYIRPVFSIRKIHDIPTTAVLLFAMGVAGIGGNLLGGMLVDRFGTRPTMLAAIGANLLIFIALWRFGGPLALTVILLLAWNVVSWAYSPAINGALALAGGASRDTALALNMSSFNVGIALGSALGGVVIETSGVVNVFALGAAVLAVALMLVPPRIAVATA